MQQLFINSHFIFSLAFFLSAPLCAGADLRTLSWLVFTAVDSLVYDWYELNAAVFIPCTHCLDSERSRYRTVRLPTLHFV